MKSPQVQRDISPSAKVSSAWARIRSLQLTIKRNVTITGVTSDGGSLLGTIGHAPNIWTYDTMTGLVESKEGLKLLEALKVSQIVGRP